MVQVQTKRRIAKPLGLYIITIFDFIAVGLIPLLMIVLVLRSADLELPFWAVLLSVAIPVFVMAASVWAAFGDNTGRWLLLAFVTLMSLLLIINNLILFSTGEVPRQQTLRAAGIIIRAAFWIAVNWWYFNRAHVVAYFKQNK